MNLSSRYSPEIKALPLLIPALGLVLLLRAAALPPDLLTHSSFYVGCMAGAWVCFAGGVFWVRRYPSACSGSMGMGIILGAAFLMRVPLLPIRPTITTDIYRYLWDGRVLLAGHNPYSLPPDSPSLASLRTSDWHHINYPSVRTPYPPVSEAFFGLMAWLGPGSVLAMKIGLGLCELPSLWLLSALLRQLQRPRSDLLLYAWSPLVIAETWLHGHNDCIGVTLLLACLLVLCRSLTSPVRTALTSGSSAWIAGLWLGLAAMGKLHAMLGLPILLRRLSWRGLLATVITMLLCFVPFYRAGTHMMEGAQRMAADWVANGSIYPLLSTGFRFLGLSDRITRAVCGMLLLVGLTLLARRPSGQSMDSHHIFRRTGYAFVLAYLLNPAMQPWYLLWVAPFVALTLTPSFLVFTGTVTLWYLGGVAVPLAYLPVYFCLAAEGWQVWRNRLQATASTDSGWA